MKNTLVLGAGIAGVCAALALQERGWTVALVDRGEPGAETSFGNAGIIQREAVEPYAMPRDPRVLWSILRGATNDVHWHLASLGGHAGALLRYWWHSQPSRHRDAARAYERLIALSTQAHAPLIDAADAAGLVRRDGFRMLHRTPRALEAATAVAERLHSEYGVPFRPLSAAELVAAEPGLRHAEAGAIHWLAPWSVRDPGELVAAYARLFTRRGGTFVHGDAGTLGTTGKGWQVTTADGGRLQAECAVVALGPWSADVFARLGRRFPMVRKRGYHKHYAGQLLNAPLMDVAFGYVMAPMTQGLRITTGAELTGPDSPVCLRQLTRAEAAARELLPLGEPVEKLPWFGTRPCMPDMLPVIGRVSALPGLWADFGHGHQGLTLGPATGAILADIMDGRAPAVDAAPFSPDRLS
jgi:D-amino-acid dehydrogenase